MGTFNGLKSKSRALTTRLLPSLLPGLPITKTIDGIGKLKQTRIPGNSMVSSKRGWLNIGMDERPRFDLEAFCINPFLALLSTIANSDS